MPMWFEQIVREETGCAAYMIGAAAGGACAVFDPLWDITPYLEMAERKEATITHVIDSHSHADHISGARRLAQATGATLWLPALADVHYEAQRLDGGDRIDMGEVTLQALHAPGHRPEQINLLVIDRSRGDAPWCLLTADFLLVGDVARPDLAQGGTEGAETLFDVSLPRLLALPDFVEVYPGHVAGST
jgi:glyoxylase-like metal-dependent hydrolase (beta-lactamase superfamily II)